MVRYVETGNFAITKVDRESEESVEISFGPSDLRDLMFSYLDALVCIEDIANC